MGNWIITFLFFTVLCVSAWFIFAYQINKLGLRLVSCVAVLSSTIGTLLVWVGLLHMFVHEASTFGFKVSILGIPFCFFPWLILQNWYKEFLLEKGFFPNLRKRNILLRVGKWTLDIYRLILIFMFAGIIYMVWLSFRL